MTPIQENRAAFSDAIDDICPLSGISRLLTDRVPYDRLHGRGAAHFLATYIVVVILEVCCKLLVACCNLQLASFNFNF